MIHNFGRTVIVSGRWMALIRVVSGPSQTDRSFSEFLCPWLCALGKETEMYSLVPHRCQHDRETVIFWGNQSTTLNNVPLQLHHSFNLMQGLFSHVQMFLLIDFSCVVCFSFYGPGEWNRTFSYCWKEIRRITCKHHNISLCNTLKNMIHYICSKVFYYYYKIFLFQINFVLLSFLIIKNPEKRSQFQQSY